MASWTTCLLFGPSQSTRPVLHRSCPLPLRKGDIDSWLVNMNCHWTQQRDSCLRLFCLQISTLQSQIHSQESDLQSQEEELTWAKADLGRLQHEENQLEQSLAAGKIQLETIIKSLKTTQDEINQVGRKTFRCNLFIITVHFPPFNKIWTCSVCVPTWTGFAASCLMYSEHLLVVDNAHVIVFAWAKTKDLLILNIWFN